MSDLIGKKIITAALEENVFCPGIGDLRKELNPSSYPGINMVYEGDLVLVEVINKQTRQVQAIRIPASRFKYLQFEKEVEPLPKPLR